MSTRIRILRMGCVLAMLAGASAACVAGGHGMVASSDSLAAEVGVEILRNGGNAIDAAVAVGFALAVTYPEAGNLGGGGYMVIKMAGKDPVMIDFRERAPGGSSRMMYGDTSSPASSGNSLRGGLSSGVPGTVAGLLDALSSYGSMTRRDVLRRPIEFAERGIRVNTHLADALREEWPEICLHPSTLMIFSHEGAALRAGDTLWQPDLAKSLHSIEASGKEGFYRGAIAEMIARMMQSTKGIIDAQDLGSYSPVERAPVRGSYRGYEILSASPSSGGGIILLEILNLLEQFDLKKFGQNSAIVLHLIASAAQRAYADRALYLGDPDFSRVPTESLISKEFSTRRGPLIDPLMRLPSAAIEPGTPGREWDHETTHYSVIDSAGNAVSVTVTLNELFGNKIVVEGAGFFLNNEMDDFATRPGTPNLFGLTGGEANSVQPDKRMLSSTAPTIVLRNGRPFLILGGRGGSRIPTAVAQVLINVIDFGMLIPEAVAAPRIHHQWMPDVLYYEQALPKGTLDQLQAMGYKCEAVAPGLASIEAIEIDSLSGQQIGGPDPREQGFAIGN